MGIRVLVVEDQPKILKAQIKLLETFEEIQIVGEALSGESALVKVEEVHPEVVLLDLGLPQMNGIEVTRRLKATHPEIEILIFTIFDEEEKVLDAVVAGAAGYLLKGTPVEKIVEAIKDVRAGGAVIQPNLARTLLKLLGGGTGSTSFTPSGPLRPLTSSTSASGTVSPEPSRPNAPGREAHPFDPDGRLEGAPVSGTSSGSGKSSGTSGRSTPQHGLTERELEILQIIAKGLSNNEAAKVVGLSKATIRTHLEHIYEKLDVSNRVEAVAEGIRQGIINV